jgi:GNAT superfamily N-acetyltransferase
MRRCGVRWPRRRASIADNFISERLGDGHSVSAFACGEQALDDWLHAQARAAHAMNTARTFVWHAGDMKVVAYYSLAAYAIAPDEVSRSMAGGARRQIPAILLARLALDRGLRGRGLGAKLLGDALERAAAAASVAAARIVVVDAISVDAERFYEHFGFARTPIPRRLVLRMSTVIETLRRQEPTSP